MKVLLATEKPFAKDAKEAIQKIITDAGFEFVSLEKYTNKSELIQAISEVDAVIVRSDIIDKEVIDASKNLKIIVRAGAGYDNIDLASATSKNIVVMNTPGQNANAVAELAFGMMIYLNRKFFDGSTGVELRNKTIGIHAFGFVGRYMAKIAKGFGMKVYAFDPFIDKKIFEEEDVIALNDVKDLYKNCQYVSLNLPANDQTKKSINYELMSLMPTGATLVNTARKEIINEDDLIKIFRERQDFRYISDITPDCKEIFEKEFQGRFYFTPKKMGAQTLEANNNAGLAAARQIVNFFKNGDTTYQVNK